MGDILAKHFDKLHDCVKRCLANGAKSRREFNSMRYGVICDLKYVGYEEDETIEILKDWNQKNYRVLSYKDFISDIADYVHWVFKKDSKAGCNYFRKEGCCITGCDFMQKRRREDNVKLESEVVYTKDDIEKHLKDYEQCKNASECAYVYKIIDAKRIELGLTRNGVILMSFEQIKKALWESGAYASPTKMFASRCVITLKNSGLLEIAVKGKPGCFNRHANGYKLKTPDDVMKDDLLNYREDLANDSSEDAHSNLN